MSLLASIDIGTNSAILLVAETGQGPLRPVLQQVTAPRVGRNLAATGRIADDAFAALMTALDGYLARIREAGAVLAGAVATEAFRKAANGPVLLERVSERLGVPCRILTGEEEARLAFLAVADRHPAAGLTVIDIGAGSTEVTHAGGGVSLPIGAVSLLEAAGPAPADLRARALAAFRSGLPSGGPAGELVAVGGTASALAMLALGLRAFDAAAIEGLPLGLADVTAAIGHIADLPPEARAVLPGLDPGRAEIIIPGLSILEAFLFHSGREVFRVSDRGIRYGVILEALAQGGPHVR